MTSFGRHVLGNWWRVLVVKEEVLHFVKLLLISLKDIIVLFIENNLDLLSSLDILKLLKKVESALRRVKLVLESSLNQTDNMLIDLLNLAEEVIELDFPVAFISLGEDVLVVDLELLDLLFHLLDLIVNLRSITCDSFEIRTEDGVELLDDHTSLFKVTQNSPHVNGLLEDLLLSCEVPSLDGLLLLNVSTGGIVLLLPLREHRLALLDDPDGIFWLLLEDLGDVDLGLHFVAHLVRYSLKDVLEFDIVLVDVSRDGPDKFQTGQERRKGFLDHWELSHVDVLELSGESVQEFNEVFGFRMILLEQVVLLVVVLKRVAVGLLGVGLHHVDDLLDLGHVQLLVESVEGSASLSPVLGHTLGRFSLVRLSVLSVNSLFNDQSPLFL